MSYNPGEYDWDSQELTAGPSSSRGTRPKTTARGSGSSARGSSSAARDTWGQMDVDDEPPARPANRAARADAVPGLPPQVRVPVALCSDVGI